jgi:hypothetical protein
MKTSLWLSVDPKAELMPGWSPYVAMNNNPIYYIDPDGQFSISNHYLFTSRAFTRLKGYSKQQIDQIAHYTSVYADHPAKWITYQQGHHYRKGVDYSKTASSQNTASKVNSTWHAMTADNEKISNADAMERGQSFGWGKIIEAGSSKGTAQLEALGQGIHALQDAIAHKGVDMDNHDLVNDMNPSKADAKQAENVAYNGILVSEVIGGNYANITNGMTIDLTGTTKNQYNTIKSAFQKAVDSNSKDNIQKVFFTGKPTE